jgi:putative spermidine/putrescine transport system substrate-binding protein
LNIGSAKKVWPTGNLQAIDTSKIKLFDKISPIFTTGKLTPESVVAQGTAPSTVGFVADQGAKEFAPEVTNWMTLIPTIYNADTLGIRPDLIGRPIESWAELLNPEFKGKASILDISSIGIMDMAMVCEAMGEIKYADKGNMTTMKSTRPSRSLPRRKRLASSAPFGNPLTKAST